ncbi:uncharacterized protein LOC129292868 [Prosopis cineraria]|uniref:uncharacterized protein LOC129292868 n=1 Tax=Prosopis cineraria TaxID=364024 RepID=UPI00240F8FCA|nr:uncharacterized protein LOC129292868 [Prosopis cineraria]XP_054786513.1 uncharacterized protein LOC129292868 [Prosopis cineraria]XP_054786514.1 uncharacterized protein LOC129292868 [Prosopis cineraria]XP_054786515.1 uncharacterized protein LOC129292868 [Prosopis cineraria]XP_054786516.1 uncharacterized protein LOC129292868 [Prosopis cineraria]
MSDPYERVKGGRLSFKGGTLATRSKAIDKKKKKKKNKHSDGPTDGEIDPSNLEHEAEASAADGGEGVPGESYTIDAAKKMKYEELFPVEAKKFGYQSKTNFKSIEEALDDRVKKKADRYCK